MLRASSNQNLINFELECKKISRKLFRASPSQNFINFQLECNRNFKETAQGQPKPESHQFPIRM